MYVCWVVHQDTYLDIWVGRVIIIKCQDNNLLCYSKLGYVTCFGHVCFHWVLHRIFGLWPLLYYSCLHPILPLVFYSTSLLLLSYHTMNILYLISLVISLLAPACLYPRHSFQYMFTFQIYRYTCVYLCTPFGISITARWRILTPLDPHVQVSEIGAYGFS